MLPLAIEGSSTQGLRGLVCMMTAAKARSGSWRLFARSSTTASLRGRMRCSSWPRRCCAPTAGQVAGRVVGGARAPARAWRSLRRAELRPDRFRRAATTRNQSGCVGPEPTPPRKTSTAAGRHSCADSTSSTRSACSSKPSDGPHPSCATPSWRPLDLDRHRRARPTPAGPALGRRPAPPVGETLASQ
jgi:hypothetical protein